MKKKNGSWILIMTMTANEENGNDVVMFEKVKEGKRKSNQSIEEMTWKAVKANENEKENTKRKWWLGRLIWLCEKMS